jgi:cobaltochelatase CobS
MSDSVLSSNTQIPDRTVSSKEVFGTVYDIQVPAFSERNGYVPEIDPAYCFDPIAVQAIVMGFANNRRVFLYGMHGSGKSTHIEQVAARLNWPCYRVNLDSHISRVDLLGRDTIVLENGSPVTAYQEGIIPKSLRNPMALIFDEYDAGRPDIMFVLQRVLESDGKFALLHKNEIIEQHPYFRIFATSNTLGQGDTTGLYHGTQQINQGQMDRWSIVTKLDYLSETQEIAVLLRKFPNYDTSQKRQIIHSVVQTAGMIREAFRQGNMSVVMSPRTVFSWMENMILLEGNVELSFRFSFFDRCEESEKGLVAEIFQRCFGNDLPGFPVNPEGQDKK